MNPSATVGTHRLGAHMSIAGGLHRAVERARQVDATALQVFVKSSRQWKSRPLNHEEIRVFGDALGESGLAPYTLAHSSYLINLASPDPDLWERSVTAFAEELERCTTLGIPFLVLHPGSHVGSGEPAGLERVAQALRRLLGDVPPGPVVTVLLETTAGQGSNLGHRFEHLADISEGVGGDRLGICFDTCHVFSAGYDFRDPESYRKTLAHFDDVVGLDRIRAFHLNDSVHDLGSRRDRHAHIGRGHIGREGFRLLLQDKRFAGIPMVLETPKGEGLTQDIENLTLLRTLCEERGGRT